MEKEINDNNNNNNNTCGRHYLEAQQRAQEVLSHSKITENDILYVLSSLPQPKNTRRIGVIPTGKTFVHSQAAGLTTQHGAKPTLSSICLKCPLVVTVLSRFVLDYDPNFIFTTITINYNYAAAPHQDVNHEDGKARIIALGNFEGGELHIDGIGDINVRNNWYDFDGTILHSTKPFTGERYSLVYFTHLSWRLPEGEEVGRKLVALGVPWPIPLSNINSNNIKTDINNDHNFSEFENLSINKLSLNTDSYEYYFLPLKKRHQYEDALQSEISSLCSLYLDKYLQNNTYQIYPPILRLFETDNNSENNNNDSNSNNNNNNTINQSNLQPYGIIKTNTKFNTNDDNEEEINLQNEIQLITNRAITFTVWRRICSSCSLESLFQAQMNIQWKAPPKFSIEIYSPGKKLSTRQKRKVLLLAQLSRSNSSENTQVITNTEQYNDQHIQLSLILLFDWSERDEDGSQGKLSSVHLCELINPQSESINKLQSKKLNNKTNNLSNSNINNSVEGLSINDVDLVNISQNNSLPTIDSTTTVNNDNNNNNNNSIEKTHTASTALRLPLCKLICNLGKITNYSFCYDPFCGSGTILRVIHQLGGYCLGSDVYHKQLILSLESNQNYDENNYNIISGNIFQANIYHQSVKGFHQFDCIICDPPYGRREKHVNEIGVDVAQHETNDERALTQFKILIPLINLSSKLLKLGGRLVFLFLNYPNSTTVKWNAKTDLLYSTDSMRVIHKWSENWEYSSGHAISRDTIVMERYN